METLHILLVDDDRDDHDFFSIALDSITNRVINLTWKVNGVEAIRFLESETSQPDLIIMDLNMPLKDGFQTLSEIKNNKRLSHIPVHIFTTSADHSAKCKQLGCTGYFSKPVSLDGYRSSIQKMLAEEYFPALKIRI